MNETSCVSVMGSMCYLDLMSPYFRTWCYRCCNGSLLIACLLMVLWSSKTVTADDPASDFNLNKLFDPHNTSDSQTYYAIAIPNFNWWHVAIMVLSVLLILSCCAFCTYYPFALLQQWMGKQSLYLLWTSFRSRTNLIFRKKIYQAIYCRTKILRF